MAVTKTIGGERLGSGNKMKVALRNYERSTHNLSYIWRSSIAPGALVPFCKQLGLNGDSFEIDLQTKVRTLPTVMPLFGTYKLQLDIFFAPIRLYQGLLHNNMVKIGMNMNKVRLPKIKLKVPTVPFYDENGIDNSVIAPTSLLHYLGIKGTGQAKNEKHRLFNAVPTLAYYDIFKNYYSFKQEDNAYCVTTSQGTQFFKELTYQEVGQRSQYDHNPQIIYNINDQQAVTQRLGFSLYQNQDETEDEVQRQGIIKGLRPNTYIGDGTPFFNITIHSPSTQKTAKVSFQDLFAIKTIAYNNESGDYKGTDDAGNLQFEPRTLSQTKQRLQATGVNPEEYISEQDAADGSGMKMYYIMIRSMAQTGATINKTIAMQLQPFPLENIDKARQTILRNCELDDEVTISADNPDTNLITWLPYSTLVEDDPETPQVQKNRNAMNGLMLKTYMSDIFNNWVTATWVEQINELSAVNTTGSSFTMESLYFKQKQYEILNAVAISGGTWEDWQEAIWGQDAVRRAEIPIYMGGMSSEIVFDEVVSNSASETTSAGEAPLGTLAGRGVETSRKGGNIRIKVDEPGYIIGIVSITPRIDYSQGNDWDTTLNSIDDLHKPGLDQIGFQDLITEKMSAIENIDGKTNSAGKQPAWLDYMTNYNRCHGDFAEENKAMAMTLNRRYEYEKGMDGFYHIKDLTTYIDPAKFNYAFAETQVTSQNFWLQIAVDMISRRKMSAKIMPNL